MGNKPDENTNSKKSHEEKTAPASDYENEETNSDLQSSNLKKNEIDGEAKETHKDYEDSSAVDLYEKMPTRVKESFFGMISQSMKSTNLIDKFNDKHIDQVIQSMENDSKRQYEYAVGERRYNSFYIILVIAVFLFLIFTIGPDTEFFKLLIIIVSVAAGGFGIGKTYRK